MSEAGGESGIVRKRSQHAHVRADVPDQTSSPLVHGMVEAALEGFEPSSVHAVLHAACSSPTAIHRAPSLAAVLVGLIARPPRGVRRAGPDDVDGWLAALRVAEPVYAQFEDCLPINPRQAIRVRFGNGQWPVHPGLIARPREVVAEALRYADSVDPILIPCLGFGIADLTELALRMMAAERAALSPFWLANPATDPAAPAVVSLEEVTAAAALLDAWRAVDLTTTLPEVLFVAMPPGGDDSPGDAHRLRLLCALQWSSPRPGRTRLAFGHEHEFLSAFVVPTRHGVIPVPGGLILAALATMTAHLLVQAAALDAQQHRGDRTHRGLAARLHATAYDRMVDTLRALPAHVVSEVVLDNRPGSAPVALIAPAARHVVALAVAAAPTSGEVKGAVNRAIRHLRRVTPGVHVRVGEGVSAVGHRADSPGEVEEAELPFGFAALSGGAAALHADVVVTRVVIVDGPARQSLRFSRGAAVVGLDEWCDLVARIDDFEELWAFLDELSGQPGLAGLAAWSVRDLWAVFKQYGLFSASTDRKDTVMVPLADLTDDRQRDGAVDRLDGVLARLGLPAVPEWPQHALRDEDGSVVLGATHPYQLVFVGPALPVAVRLIDGQPGTHRSLGVSLASALFDGIQSVVVDQSVPDRDRWRALVGEAALVVTITLLCELPDGELVRFVGIDGREIMLACGERALYGASSRAVQNGLGDAVAVGAAMYSIVAALESPPQTGTFDSRSLLDTSPEMQRAHVAFMTAWRALPDVFTKITSMTPFTAATTFLAPCLTRTGQARAVRLVTQELRRRQTPAAVVTGAAAVDLLRTVVAPATMRVLTDLLDRFEPDQALAAVTSHLERLWADRREQEAQYAMRVGNDPASAELLEDLDSTDGSRDAIAWRAATLIVESLVCTPPTGTSRLDRRDWIQLHHLASYAIELAELSTAAAMGLYTLTVTVDEAGVVLIEHDQVRVNLPAYMRARHQVHLRHVAAELPVDPPTAAEEYAPGDQQAGQEFQSIRTALRAAAERPARGQDGGRKEALCALAVDEAMRAHLGTGIDEISAVYATAVVAGAGRSWRADRGRRSRRLRRYRRRLGRSGRSRGFCGRAVVDPLIRATRRGA